MLRKLVHKVLAWVVPVVLWLYIWLTRLTSRMQVTGAAYPDSVREAGSGYIYAFWHNRQIILPLLRREESIHCLISPSRDGEHVARVIGWFGKKSVRGSTTYGGFEAMKAMMRILGNGGIVAMTPDGPQGPPHKVKPGVIQMARSLQCPIIPLAFDATHQQIFTSWDSFRLPLPFSRIAVVFGEPFRVDPEESVDSGCLRLEQALNAATLTAARALEK